MEPRAIVFVTTVAAMLSVSTATHTQSPQLAPPAPAVDARGPIPQVADTGILRGRVTRLDNGQPLRRVLITAAGTTMPPMTFTDDNGRFELNSLRAGSYTLTASKGGFVTLQYGQRRPNEPGRPIQLAEGAVVENLGLALPRGSAIMGRVFDRSGAPVVDATVQVLRRRYVRGRPELTASMGTPDTTDDRGEFRVYGLEPGTYYLSVSAPTGRGEPRSSGPVTFYPGTSSPEAAQPISVGLGEEIAGLWFAMVPFELAAIAGVVRVPDGGSMGDVSVNLARIYSGGATGRGGSLRPDGSFSYASLAPGEYTLWASTRSGDGIAVARVALDGADVNVVLTLRKSDIARGRITFEAGTASESLRPSQVGLGPISLDRSEFVVAAGQTVIRDDWTFEVPVSPGARLLRATLPTGWAIKSVRAGRRDVTDIPLLFDGSDIDGIEILLTNRLTEVSGTVHNGRGEPVADGTVVLLADDPQRWGPDTRFVAVARPDSRARFRHRGLPAGRYVAVAVEYLEPGEETNPETLEELQRVGVRFTLEDGGSRTLDLTLANRP